jgi:signal transduction histidine kinase
MPDDADEQVRRLASTPAMAEHEERRRIARLLHDDIQQRLYSIQMRVGLLRDGAADDAQAAALSEVHDLLGQTIDRTRDLSVDLSPPILERTELTDALGWLATQMASMHGLHVEVVADRSVPIADDDLRVLLFEIVRELLFNVVKHAAVDRARVELGIDDDQLSIVVSDEGRGFDPAGGGGGQTGGRGLSSAPDRLARVGGAIEIRSGDGAGTTVTLAVPLGADAR